MASAAGGGGEPPKGSSKKKRSNFSVVTDVLDGALGKGSPDPSFHQKLADAVVSLKKSGLKASGSGDPKVTKHKDVYVKCASKSCNGRALEFRLKCPDCCMDICKLCNEAWHSGPCIPAIISPNWEVTIEDEDQLDLECPFTGCGGKVSKFKLLCPECSLEFCKVCKRPWHEGRSCVLGMLAKWESGDYGYDEEVYGEEKYGDTQADSNLKGIVGDTQVDSKLKGIVGSEPTKKKPVQKPPLPQKLPLPPKKPVQIPPLSGPLPPPPPVGGGGSGIVCLICSQAFPPSFVWCPLKCKHSLCMMCIRDYAGGKSHRNSGQLKCPVDNCEEVITPATLQGIIPNKVLEKWVSSSRVGDAQANTTVIQCPFPDCGLIIFFTDGRDSLFRACPYCGKLFCTKCRVFWHCQDSCEEFESSLAS